VVELTPAGLAVATRVNDALHEWEGTLALTDAQQRETARVVDRLLDRFASRQLGQSDTGVSAPVSTS
jgi:DNA-binding transcriptional LysR family regulator